MKYLLAFLMVMGSTLALADDILGNKIEFYSKNNQPQFGVQMAEGHFSMTFTVNGYDLAKNKSVTSVVVQFFDGTANRPVGSSIRVAKFVGGVYFSGTQVFTLTLPMNEVKSVIK